MKQPGQVDPHANTLALATAYFLGACLLLALLAWPGYSSYLSARQQAGIDAQKSRLQLIKDYIDREFFEVAADAMLLSEQPLVKAALLDTPSGKLSVDDLAAHFLRMAYTLQRYDQLRLLNASGHELVRIQYREGIALPVAATQLNNRSTEAYFRTVKTLHRGQVFVSSLDLNESKGMVERPFVPIVRFVVPVLDDNNVFIGAIALNYKVQSIISTLQALFEENSNHVRVALLNEEGYWISSAKPEQNWGWKVGRSDLTLRRQNPQLWRTIDDAPMGQTSNDNAVYVFRGIYPLETIALTGAEVVTLPWPAVNPGETSSDISSMRWSVLVTIASGLWLEGTLLDERWLQLVLVGLRLALALGCWALAHQRSLQQAIRNLKDESARELEAIYDHAPCAYQSINKHGVIVRMNKTGLGWVGYEANEVIDHMHYNTMLQADETLEHHHVIKSPEQIMQERGTMEDYPMTMVRKDGSSFPVSVSAVAVFDETGRYIMTRTTVVNVTERRRLERDLLQQAHTDDLTGALNRRHFQHLAQQELERVQRQGMHCALIMLDLDHFKRINDTHGHAAGDIALKAFAELCQQSLRATDLLARTGGEEFAALLPDTSPTNAAAIAERIRHAVESSSVTLKDGRTLAFTVSIGITALYPSDQSLDGPMGRADRCLYQAKAQGRNQVVWA
jgi:diguanylate cyclase (GGDEF)-like protein/PAS domain S-box-containing protein